MRHYRAFEKQERERLENGNEQIPKVTVGEFKPVDVFAAHGKRTKRSTRSAEDSGTEPKGHGPASHPKRYRGG